MTSDGTPETIGSGGIGEKGDEPDLEPIEITSELKTKLQSLAHPACSVTPGNLGERSIERRDPLFPVTREGIYGSSLPEGARPYSRADDEAMMERIAVRHAAWMDSVRLPDGTIPEVFSEGGVVAYEIDEKAGTFTFIAGEERLTFGLEAIEIPGMNYSSEPPEAA